MEDPEDLTIAHAWPEVMSPEVTWLFPLLFSRIFFPYLFYIFFPYFFFRTIFPYFFKSRDVWNPTCRYITVHLGYMTAAAAILTKVWGKNTWKKVWEKKVWEKKVQEKKVREKRYRKKSKGKSHVTSSDITSGQACGMVRSSGSSTNTTWKPLLYYLSGNCHHSS